MVGDADIYVGARRDVSASQPDSYLFSSAKIGDDYLYLAHGSLAYKRHCNRRVIESHGACTFYILITASVPSKYTLTADLQTSDITYIPVGRPFSGVLKPKQHKTFVLAELKPGFDYELTSTNEGAGAGVDNPTDVRSRLVHGQLRRVAASAVLNPSYEYSKWEASIASLASFFVVCSKRGVWR